MTMRPLLLALCLTARHAHGQARTEPVSVAVVEGGTGWVERTHTVAPLVRARLERVTTRRQLRVVRQKDVVAACEQGCPDRWTPEYLRGLAQLLRADLMVELTTSMQGGAVTAQALVYHPSSPLVDTLPVVRGATDTAVAGQLAGKLSEMLERLYEQKLDSAPGAARLVSIPERSYLVDVMRQRAGDSPLGDLRRRATAPEDVEVRAWGGFGLGGTAGVVLRRERGAWRAWFAQVVPCRIDVAGPIGDTASATTAARFVAVARKKCGTSIGDVSRGALLFDADTLAITPLKADGRAIEGAWDAAVREGLLTLPPMVPRKWLMMDGFSYVIEVRRGAEYRASAIERVDEPEVPADTEVKRVYEALTKLVPERSDAPPVPASAPDSVPAPLWSAVTSPANLLRDPPGITGSVIRDLVYVSFVPSATPSERQAAIDLVHGTVIGGMPIGSPEGFYAVRIPYLLAAGDSTSGPILRAQAALSRLPAVSDVLLGLMDKMKPLGRGRAQPVAPPRPRDVRLPPVCTTDVAPGLIVEIRDARSSRWIADSATVLARDGSFVDTLRAGAIVQDGSMRNRFGAYERPGTYAVEVRRPGYRPWRTRVVLARGECHVETAFLHVDLEPDR